jgi:NACalpha-BTF3-like transcription factor
MALEGANIMGQAQVYNQTQNAVNTYMKSVAQQQAKLAAEQKALQDDLAKVKIEGIRQGDMPEFLESYNKSKEIFAKLNATRDTAEKIRLKREFDESMLNTAAIGADSRELAKGEDAASRMFMNPNIRDRYKPEAVEQFQLSKSLSRKDPRYVRDLSTLEQQIDLSKIMSDLDKIDSELFKGEKSNLIETKGSRDGVSGFYVMEERKLSPERQALAYSAQFDLQPSFRVAMREIFPQFAELNNAELKAAVIPELVKQRAKSIYEDEKFVRTGMTEGERRRLALAESRASDGGSNPSNYAVETDTYLYTDPKQRNEYDEPIAGSEKKSMRMVKSVGFDTDYFPLIDASAFDVDKQNKNAKVSGNFIVGKLAYVPIDDGSVDLRAVVVNSDGERYVVKPNVLPIGIRKSKNYKAALKALGSAPSKASKESKSYSEIEEQGIKAVMEKSKVTRQEAINALVAAGRLSK